MFAYASNLDFELFRRRFTEHHIRDFNVRISNWRVNNNWTDDDIVGLILYCYNHNPLLAESATAYGNLKNIGQSITLYKGWCYNHEEEIEAAGLFKTIVGTANEDPYGEVLSNAMTLEEVYAVYGKH